jgi:hypothetical protein
MQRHDPMNRTRHVRWISLALLAFGCAPSTEATRLGRVGDSGMTPADGAETPDAAADAAPEDAGPPRWVPPAGTDPACVSGTRWTMGNEESVYMNPGQPCVACHRMDRGAPQHTAAGTAYFLDHEANTCNGYTGSAPGGPSGTAVVEVEDATGRMVRMTVNAAGNFFTRTALTFPLRVARVVGPTGLTAEMGSPVPHGDCNACHTQQGTTTVMGADPAPGRVVVPL